MGPIGGFFVPTLSRFFPRKLERALRLRDIKKKLTFANPPTSQAGMFLNDAYL